MKHRERIQIDLVDGPGIVMGYLLTKSQANSSDPQGSPLQFQIAWGDGNMTGWASSANASHVYARAGNYTVTLTSRNGLDLSGTAKATLLVNPKPKAAANKGFIPGPTAFIAVISLTIAFVILGRRKEPPVTI